MRLFAFSLVAVGPFASLYSLKRRKGKGHRKGGGCWPGSWLGEWGWWRDRYNQHREQRGKGSLGSGGRRKNASSASHVLSFKVPVGHPGAMCRGKAQSLGQSGEPSVGTRSGLRAWAYFPSSSSVGEGGGGDESPSCSCPRILLTPQFGLGGRLTPDGRSQIDSSRECLTCPELLLGEFCWLLMGPPPSHCPFEDAV